LNEVQIVLSNLGDDLTQKVLYLF
jgi:hypothetical protein